MAIVTTNLMEKDAGAGASLSVTIRKSLGEFTLDSEFTAAAGITTLFGASGSGKTTLLNCLAGLSRPDSGRIAIGDRALFDSERRIDIPAEQRNVGYVFQDLALFPHLSVGANVNMDYFVYPFAAGASVRRRYWKAFALRICATASHGRFPGGSVSGWRWLARW